MWLWLVVGAVIVYVVWHSREGMSPNAYEMSQLQQGKIKRFYSQLNGLTFNKNDIDELNKNVKANNDNTNDMTMALSKKNANKRKDAYPDLIK